MATVMLLNGQTIKPPLDTHISEAPNPQTSFSAVDELTHSEGLCSAQPYSSQVQGTSRKSGEGKTKNQWCRRIKLNITGLMPSDSQQHWFLVEGLLLSSPVGIPAFQRRRERGSLGPTPT